MIACVMRLSLSTLPWELLSRTILREFWRKDLWMLEIFSASIVVRLSESFIGLLSSMPVPGGVRWKNGEAISSSLGISGRVVPMTDFPILFFVSDIDRAVLTERAEGAVRLENFRVGEE